MFSGPVLGLLIGASAATWTYNKVMRQTGNNTKNSAVVAGIVGFFGFVFGWSTLAIIESITG